MQHRQKIFVEEYLKDLNATQAAIRAGYSEKTAYSIGQENLNKPEIAEAIAEAMAKRSERTRIDADWLLRRLADEAEADIADIFDDEGKLLPVREWPKIFRKGLVAGIDVTKLGEDMTVTKIKLADKNAKLKMIGDHIGVQAFKQILQHGGDPNNPLRVESTINVEGLSSAALEELANLRRK